MQSVVEATGVANGVASLVAAPERRDGRVAILASNYDGGGASHGGVVVLLGRRRLIDGLEAGCFIVVVNIRGVITGVIMVVIGVVIRLLLVALVAVERHVDSLDQSIVVRRAS